MTEHFYLYSININKFRELQLAKPSDEVAVDKFGLKIKTRDLSLYDKPEWLDDAVSIDLKAFLLSFSKKRLIPGKHIF